MNKILLSTVLVLSGIFTYAQQQVQTPQDSPSAKFEQAVGLTQFTIEYSRPGVKGRTIFGDLLPYGKLWRAGANKNTTISFTDAIFFGDTEVKAGTYAIYITPKETQWEVVLYTDTNNWGAPKTWDDSKVAAMVTVPVEEVPFLVETYTIDINSITSSGATLEFIWEKTYAAVPITVPTDNKVLTSINDALNNNPSADDYYAAAVYFYNEKKDVKQAKEWMDKAMSQFNDPKFYQLRKQALIYARYGDKEGAIKIAKKSLEGAKAAGNDDYIKMNTESLKEWGTL